ncbi:transaldolase family protein [Peribacillus loiseleuriae]|uniref:transaldolase family protein n=1 Tax=Peribacillus loiseleuriae TaxID=1679170 RepID=UPI003822DB53
MKYLIDSANQQEIDHSLRWGVAGVTANPSLYVKGNIDLYEFISRYSDQNILLTAEVIGNDYEDMTRQVEKITEFSKDIVIKLNYSASNLKFAQSLKKKGIQTAITLIFDVNQAMLALQAGVEYVFLFVSRNEEMGVDGLEFVQNVSKIIKLKDYRAKVIAASIRTKFQLESVALYADYIAAPFRLIEESFHHPLTLSGTSQFEADMKKVREVIKP